MKIYERSSMRPTRTKDPSGRNQWSSDFTNCEWRGKYLQARGHSLPVTNRFSAKQRSWCTFSKRRSKSVINNKMIGLDESSSPGIHDNGSDACVVRGYSTKYNSLTSGRPFQYFHSVGNLLIKQIGRCTPNMHLLEAELGPSGLAEDNMYSTVTTM